MNIRVALLLLSSPCWGLPELPPLIEHPPVAHRLGVLRELATSAAKEEVYVCVIRTKDHNEKRFYLDFSKNRGGEQIREFDELLEEAGKVLKGALPPSNLEGSELVGFTRVIGPTRNKDVWLFQYIVKDFTPAGGAGYYPTVVVALSSNGKFLGRVDDAQSD